MSFHFQSKRAITVILSEMITYCVFLANLNGCCQPNGPHFEETMTFGFITVDWEGSFARLLTLKGLVIEACSQN